MMNIFLLYLSLQKVETQNFASHKQGWEINWGEDMTVIVAFVVRETQGWAISWSEDMAVIAAFVVRETQDFASLQADAIVMA
ncbi:hypothetical protein [Leyella lascolaii]|uniref:hypothetical protein n=1 Tax=Leyella lascolaii TaxID=1776379 RepID=UPI00083A4036|nr:hypothetical protein [Leyella lascolaii]